MMTTEPRVTYGFGPTQTILDDCAEHPNEETHECMAAEYKCVYCGDALKPWNGAPSCSRRRSECATYRGGHRR